ncbi:nuclear transport factor 2-like [Actinidia eriantha]|uniref:nuclear transport factor 2-like n=1 Tax=Actinidia eriantha TaxID=165200 RepID=UPI0025910EA8|nr:nuclear transport factor 2-like [Actinidia eriantha]
MAMQAANHVAFVISAEVIGNAFVEEYYHLLHQSPELLYGFYIRPSALSGPNSNSVITSAINKKILSLGCGNCKAELKTVDVQEPYKGGLIIFVTGCLTGKDNVRRKFTQTFFLAPQVTGYFVLNDDFRYVVESESLEDNSMSISGIIYNTPVVPLPSDPEPIPDPDHPAMELAATFDAEDLNEGTEVCDRSDSDEGSVLEEEVTDEINTVVGSVPCASQEEKKSYASIMSNFIQMKVTEVVRASTPVYAPNNSVRLAAAVNPYQQSAKPSPELEASSPRGDNAPESTDVCEEVVKVRGRMEIRKSARFGCGRCRKKNTTMGQRRFFYCYAGFVKPVPPHCHSYSRGVDSKMTTSGVVGTLVAAGDEFRKQVSFQIDQLVQTDITVRITNVLITEVEELDQVGRITVLLLGKG